MCLWPAGPWNSYLDWGQGNCYVSKVDDSIVAKGSGTANICLSCGLCCNGASFGDVKLLPREDAAELRALGMPLSRTGCARGRNHIEGAAGAGWRFLQPCAAFDGCRCDIYSVRPRHCRDFECLLLRKLETGTIRQANALRVIRRARRQAEKVRKLLRSLGDEDETLALAQRYRRMAKRLRRKPAEPEVAQLFGELTVAFHKLSVTLQQSFYPG